MDEVRWSPSLGELRNIHVRREERDLYEGYGQRACWIEWMLCLALLCVVIGGLVWGTQ